jgi:hypothetical protein
MTRPSFLLAVLFAALSGAGALIWVLSVRHALGVDVAVSMYALGVVPLFLLWAAPSWGRGAAAAALATALALPTAVWWPTPVVAAWTAVGALGVARLACLQRPFTLGSLGMEALLGVAALVAAAFAYDGTALSSGAAVWLACLLEFAGRARDAGLPGAPPARRAPFDAARQQVLRILEAEERRVRRDSDSLPT